MGTAAPDAEVESEDYDLADEDRWEAQTYVHQGLSQRTMDEECAKLDDPDACRGRGKTKFMGVDSDIIQMVSRVYSLFSGAMGMQGGGFEAKPESDLADQGEGQEVEGEAAQNGEGGKAGDEAKGEEKKDYCAMIPAAGELVATTMQTLGQEEIENTESQDSAQKAQLYKAARSHRTRASSAKIQGVTWGATTACYGYYMAAGGIVINWKVIAKAAGAGFLTLFWMNESKKQSEYADEVESIADSLPGKGDCNPHTQKNCYCSQPETQYDTNHCLEILNKKISDTTSYSVPCVDKDLKSDATCTCVGRESCFDNEFFSDLKGTGLASFGNSSAGKQFKNLTNGVLTNGKLSSATASNSASAKKFLRDLEGKVKDLPDLTKSQMEEAKAISSYGVPRSVASLLSGQKINSFEKNKVASLKGGNYGASKGLRSNSAQKSAGAVLRFNNPKSNIRDSKRGSGSNFNSMLNKFKKKSSKSNNAKVLKFAQKAEREAQITKNKDRPIFEIISRRYQVSGWRRLEIE